MNHKNCPSCKFYNMGKINIYTPDTPHSCTAGHNDVMESWWKENGHKRDRNTLTELNCFEETDLGKMLNNSLEKLDELKNKLNKQ